VLWNSYRLTLSRCFANASTCREEDRAEAEDVAAEERRYDESDATGSRLRLLEERIGYDENHVSECLQAEKKMKRN
jgi:hypothetical protein